MPVLPPTPNLGLPKPDVDSELWDADYYSAMDKIDAHPGVLVVPSPTRPPTPFDGQLIIEHDTQKLFQWDAGSATWKQVVSSDPSDALILEKRTTDPAGGSALVAGRVWIRTDTSPPKIKWYDGTTVQILADLNSVVNTITAADSTITIGGTATAVTVKVAKTLDHTYITDFDAQVRTSRLDQMAAPNAAVSFNNQLLTNLADPISAQDAVNLRTVQSMISGLSDRADVYYATTAALPTNVYNNGASGVGATLTATANGALSIDGQAVVAGQRVLILNEATAANNGIYTVTNAGAVGAAYVLTRATDFDQSAETITGAMIPVKVPAGVSGGTVNDDKIYVSVVATPATVGTTAINFTLIGSTYSAGSGLTLTGTVFSLTAPVTVLLGGTGSTTAAGARTNLGVLGHFEQDFGDGIATTFTIAHGLGNANVRASVRRKSDGVLILCGISVDATNVVVTIGTSGSPVGTNSHTVRAEA